MIAKAKSIRPISAETSIIERPLRLKFHLAVLLIVTLFMVFPVPGQASDNEIVKIGVLSFRSKQQTFKKWEETAKFLSHTIPGYSFRVIPMFYSELEKAAKLGSVDFVLTNSGHYVTLTERYGIVRIASLVKNVRGKAVAQFGGVIFTRSDRTDINSLHDLDGKSIMGVGKLSLGGFLVAWEELLRAGIDPFEDFAKLSFNGMPHDEVVLKVLNREVDAGTVRTSILENMAKEGIIDLTDIKVLGEKHDQGFPFLHSTSLYPEWPISALKDTSSDLSKIVLSALLEITVRDKAAVKAKYIGWTVPADYLVVRNLMERLRTGPFERPERFNIKDITDKYFGLLMVIAIILFLIISIVAFRLSTLNKALFRSKNELQERVEEKTADLFLSQSRLSEAQRIARIGSWDWDIVNDTLWWSEETYRLFDKDPQSFSPSYDEYCRMIHPDDLIIMQKRLNNAMESGGKPYHMITRIINNSGRKWVVEAHGLVHRDTQNNAVRMSGTGRDITYEHELSEQLSYQASHDPLTGLINRNEFERRAERLLEMIKQNNAEHALCFMDLDQFKVVNDTCGHAAGDELLRQLSSVLQKAVRKRDTLARMGGDEFGVLMEHCSLDHAHRVASSLLKAIQGYQFTWEGHAFKVGVSIGLVAITETVGSLTELLQQADAACYMAKDLGRNRIHVYHLEDSELAQRHGEMQWVTRIYQALEQDRFCLYAQHIVPLENSHDAHYEILLRMIDEQAKLIPPGAFLPAAERYNLMTQIDHWVIEKTFRLLAVNPLFVDRTNFVSINLSGQSLTEIHVLEFIIEQLEETGIDGCKICFEITETAAISNLVSAMKFISTLRGLGCRFALDDFGSGLSSFAYLKNLAVDYLKIDGIFVADMVNDPTNQAMVKSINEIGQVMGMQTIAEFVENDEIKGMLGEMGVNYAQGFGIQKPVAFDEILGLSNKGVEG